MGFTRRSHMRKSVKTLMVMLATLMVFISSSANAVYCDYCQGSGSWECRASHVIVDGFSTFSGNVCTYFYNSGGYEAPTDWYDFWDHAYGGGSFKFNVTKTLPNMPGNNNPATCHDDGDTRWLHANREVTLYNVAALAGSWDALQSGQLVKVKYDDGGSEIWEVGTTLSSSPVMNVPVPNSLKCP